MPTLATNRREYEPLDRYKRPFIPFKGDKTRPSRLYLDGNRRPPNCVFILWTLCKKWVENFEHAINYVARNNVSNIDLYRSEAQLTEKWLNVISSNELELQSGDSINKKKEL